MGGDGLSKAARTALCGLSNFAGRRARLALFARDPCYSDPVMNLTLTIDDETLKRARMRALDQGTSVNALVRDFLRSYAGSEDENLALRRFVEVGEGSGAGARSEGRVWTRDELYEERLRWPRS